jgi:hypothetical protein
MLSDRIIELTKQVILKTPSTARTEEERTFVRKVRQDVAVIKAAGRIPELPSEW